MARAWTTEAGHLVIAELVTALKADAALGVITLRVRQLNTRLLGHHGTRPRAVFIRLHTRQHATLSRGTIRMGETRDTVIHVVPPCMTDVLWRRLGLDMIAPMAMAHRMVAVAMDPIRATIPGTAIRERTREAIRV